jgi:outer membrane protein
MANGLKPHRMESFKVSNDCFRCIKEIQKYPKQRRWRAPNCCRNSTLRKTSPRRRPRSYAFGTRLRQRQFTQADFALNALNFPQPIGNFSTRFSGSWTAFDSFKTQREIRRADLFKESASSSAKAVDQQIVLQVVGAYQSVLYAQREIDVAQHEQETAAALLNSVEEHVKAGLAVESDRMSAQVNVAARKEELIAAEGELELAWAELREAMGAPELESLRTEAD